MEIPEITALFRGKAAELQKFFAITDRPEVVYSDSFAFAQALEAAADLLEAEPEVLNTRIMKGPYEELEHRTLIEWHGHKVVVAVKIDRRILL